MNKNLLPLGFKDEIFDQATLEHKYKNIIINLFQLNGYALVKPPLIEYANKQNVNNAFLIKEKNEFKDFVLRNDMTLQVARLASSRLKNKPRPLKLCYYGEVIRKKGTMLRPERQFLQVGAECIGEDSFLADVEMLDLAYQTLSAVGIRNISIELSSCEFLNFLINNVNNNNFREKIMFFIRKKDINNCLKYVDPSLHSYAKNLLFCTGNLVEKKEFLKNLMVNKNTENSAKQLLSIYSAFSLKHSGVNFFLDLSESNYFDYHTGIRFTFFAKNIRGEIARGGRYISKKDFKSESSTGFTCYMDTIIRASTFNQQENKILIPFDTSSSRKKDLISKDYIIETFFGNDDIKKKAKEKNINACLVNNKIIFL